MGLMRTIDMPAGSALGLTVTARPGAGVHRWSVGVFAAMATDADPTPRLLYGSRIGGDDRHQRIDIPAQDADCRLEVTSRHATGGGWDDDRCIVDAETPGAVRLGYCDPNEPTAPQDDILLNFVFREGS